MTDRLQIYGNLDSGNCLKVKWTADHLGIPYDWHDVDVVAGEAQTPAFRAVNPFGKVPAVILPGGELLTESNAIMVHLAEGSDLIPPDPVERAHMLQWMFWEQYSHEPYIAVRRYWLHLTGEKEEDLDPKLLERGNAALDHMERHLAGDGNPRDWFVGTRLSLADIALVAYTRWVEQGGFTLAGRPNLSAWIARVERGLAIEGGEDQTAPL